ncbi:hypothetical protein B0H11DRAFT_2286559 [Mycena galericulata]|nr:hypothetical protein B0H11DRAFT_2286559 [Mycena galericulata]
MWLPAGSGGGVGQLSAPPLVVLIEGLVPDTELSSQDPAETHDHQRVVAARRVPEWHPGYTSSSKGDVVGKYREAIVGLAALKMLHVSEGAGMWTWRSSFSLLSFSFDSPDADAAAGPVLNAPQDASPPSPRAPSVAVLWIEPHPEDAPVLPTALLDGVRAWAPTLEALYLLAGAEPHLPNRAHTSPCTCTPRPPAFLRDPPPSPLSHCAFHSALVEALANTEASSKATAPIPALPAPNLRTLTIVLAVPGPALPARADVGKGKGGVCVSGGGGVAAPPVVQALKNVCASATPHCSRCTRRHRLEFAPLPACVDSDATRAAEREPNSVLCPLHPTSMRRAVLIPRRTHANSIPFVRADLGEYRAEARASIFFVRRGLAAPPSG